MQSMLSSADKDILLLNGFDKEIIYITKVSHPCYYDVAT